MDPPIAQIPTLTEWGMIIMVGVLGTIGMLALWLRSRRVSSKKT
jgi:drug/metabolite transporter (DMT)-like permease